jgi:hypothetical protein
MKWTIIYHPRAEDELARLWLDPSIREAVTGASAQLDRVLQSSPQDAGESRASGRRIVLVPPLGAKYEISEPDRTVRVLQIWHFAKRRR